MKLKKIIEKRDNYNRLVRRIKTIRTITSTCEYETCKKYLLASEATVDNPEYYDFEFFNIGGTIYNESGKCRLCENLTVYSKRGNPIMDIEL